MFKTFKEAAPQCWEEGRFFTVHSWVAWEHLQHGDAPVLPCSLSCCLETGEANEGHRGRDGQGPDVFQQSPRQA